MHCIYSPSFIDLAALYSIDYKRTKQSNKDFEQHFYVSRPSIVANNLAKLGLCYRSMQAVLSHRSYSDLWSLGSNFCRYLLICSQLNVQCIRSCAARQKSKLNKNRIDMCMYRRAERTGGLAWAIDSRLTQSTYRLVSSGLSSLVESAKPLWDSSNLLLTHQRHEFFVLPPPPPSNYTTAHLSCHSPRWYPLYSWFFYVRKFLV